MRLRFIILIPALMLTPFFFHWSCGSNSSTPSAPVTVYVYYTATPSFTPTTCYNASQTPCTPTFTFTNTATFTPTNTPTFTLTFTKTFTPTATRTPTNSPTQTPTLTPCNYPSDTCTYSPTPVATNTPTPSPTNSPTATVTNTVGSSTPTPTPFHPWFEATPITVGGNPVGIAIMPNGTKAYVSLNNNPGKVVSINMSNFSNAATITLPRNPGSLSITSDNSEVIVATGLNESFAVIDTASDTAANTILGNCSGGTLYGVATLPGQHNAIAGDLGPGCTQALFDDIPLDGTTMVGYTLPVTCGGYGMVVSKDGTVAISTNYPGNSMAAIGTGITGWPVTTIDMNQQTYAADIFPDNSGMIVSAANGLLRLPLTGGASVTVISTELGEAGGNLSFQQVAISPDAKWAVLCSGLHVEVEDLAANAPLTTFSGVCGNVAISPDSKIALMTQYAAGKVRVLHLEP